MKIKLTSIMVDNQDKALKFYTEIFGFIKKHDIPVGEYKWLTVVSPEGPDDLELSLEHNANPAGKDFQERSLATTGRSPHDGVRVRRDHGADVTDRRHGATQEGHALRQYHVEFGVVSQRDVRPEGRHRDHDASY